MPWARFDDQFDDDPELDLIGPVAACLFACSITWCSRNLTDGFLPKARASRLCGGTPESIKLLLKYGWWVEEKDGYRVRNYLKYNPSAAQVERQRHWSRTRPKLVKAVMERDGCCVYCGSKVDLTLDHLIPQSRNGQDTADNLVAACRRCNSAKGSKTQEEWQR